MGIKNISWANLKKVSSADIGYIDAALSLFPSAAAKENISLAIRKMLMKHLGEKAFYYLDGVEALPAQNFFATMPENSVSAIIGTNKGDGRLVAHIDNNLAFLVIDKLLGGGGDFFESRPLSETEAGILQYFILQVLFSVWRSSKEDEKVHFRFERFIFTGEDVLKVFPKKESVVVFFFKVGIGEHAGFVKIAIESSLLGKMKFAGEDVKDKKELDGYFNDLSRFHYIRTSLWAEAGALTLSSRELKELEDGDVILFDDCGIYLKDKKVDGEVRLKVGQGDHGFVRAEITQSAGALKCKISG